MTSTHSWVRNKSDEWAVEAGCYFDESAPERVCEFFRKYIRHSKDEFAGKPFIFTNWQRGDLIYPIYGWKKPDGSRRFRRVFIEIPKKNGKSTLCSGLSLYHLCADGVNGAEVYNVAGDKSQASIVFDEAKNMVEASPAMSSRILLKRSLKRMDFPNTKSFYRVIASDAHSKEGFNISCLIFDELHTQKNRKLWDTLRYGGASRREPIFIVITTAGDDETSLWFEELTYAKRILSGEIRDDEYFAYVREADKNDDYKDPKVWEKANPSLGITISYETVAAEVNAAIQNPSALNTLLRYRFNILSSLSERWIPKEHWDACANFPIRPPQEKEECYVGLDLSTTTDMAGYCLWFPERKIILPRLFCPENTVTKRTALRRTRYDFWQLKNLVTVLQGETLDYNIIKQSLEADDELYSIKRLAYDPWNATQFILDLLHDGWKCEKFRQGFGSYTAPMKEFDRMIRDQVLVHYGNEVLTWMTGNLVPEYDVNKNIRPNKKASKEAIEGLLCAIMAIGLWMIDTQKASVYKKRGIVST